MDRRIPRKWTYKTCTNVQNSDEAGYNVWCRNMDIEIKGRGVTGEEKDENVSVDSQSIMKGVVEE